MQETTIYLSSKNLLHNFDYLTALARHQVWPVLKSNAYGHGLIEVAEILKERNFEYYIVQNYFEAETIWGVSRHATLMLGTEPFSEYERMDFTLLVPTVGSFDLLKHLIGLKKELRVHIKINTGMNRQGFDPKDIPEIISILENNHHIEVDGILTHFSDADGIDNSFTEKQLSCFESCIKKFQDSNINPKWIHASNSAGLGKIKSDLVNASRAGIALYGLNPLETNGTAYERYTSLKPVLTLKTFLTHIRTIMPGEHTGYGNTFTAKKETTIGTIPLGYYEGIPRILSNCGVAVSTTGTNLPVIGRVSMNLITLDISQAELSVGDEITFYSNDTNSPASVTNNASCSGTINYELTTNLKPHLRRVVI